MLAKNISSLDKTRKEGRRRYSHPIIPIHLENETISCSLAIYTRYIYTNIPLFLLFRLHTSQSFTHTHTHTFVLFISINTEAQYQWQTREQSNIIRRYTHPYKDLFLKINKCIYSTYIRFVLRLVYMCAGCCESSLFPGYFSYIGNRFPFFKRKRNVPR